MPNSDLNEVRCASCSAFISSEPSPVHPLCKASCRNCSRPSPVFATWQVPQARPRWQNFSEFTKYNKDLGTICARAGFQITKGYQPRSAPEWIMNTATRRRVCLSRTRFGAGAVLWDWSSRSRSGARADHWDWLLYWYYMVGLSPQHIAEELGISPNAVKLQIKRLLKRSERVVSHTECGQRDESATQVIALRAAGLSWREIESRTGIPRSTAGRLVSHTSDPKHQGYMRGALRSVVAATHLILPRDEKGLLARPRLAFQAIPGSALPLQGFERSG
jgi:hypothetical protein